MARNTLFDITVGDRVLLCVFSPVVVLMCGSALMMAWVWHPVAIPMKLLRVVVVDGMASLVLVTSLVLFYALAKPKWVQAMLEQHTSKAVVYLSVFLMVLCAMIVFSIIIDGLMGLWPVVLGCCVGRDFSPWSK